MSTFLAVVLGTSTFVYTLLVLTGKLQWTNTPVAMPTSSAEPVQQNPRYGHPFDVIGEIKRARTPAPDGMMWVLTVKVDREGDHYALMSLCNMQTEEPVAQHRISLSWEMFNDDATGGRYRRWSDAYPKDGFGYVTKKARLQLVNATAHWSQRAVRKYDGADVVGMDYDI